MTRRLHDSRTQDQGRIRLDNVQELVGAIAIRLALRNDLQWEGVVAPAWGGTFVAAPIRKENNKE